MVSSTGAVRRIRGRTTSRYQATRMPSLYFVRSLRTRDPTLIRRVGRLPNRGAGRQAKGERRPVTATGVPPQPALLRPHFACPRQAPTSHDEPSTISAALVPLCRVVPARHAEDDA